MQSIIQRLKTVLPLTDLLNIRGRMTRNEFWFFTLVSMGRISAFILVALAILTAAALLRIPKTSYLLAVVAGAVIMFQTVLPAFLGVLWHGLIARRLQDTGQPSDKTLLAVPAILGSTILSPMILVPSGLWPNLLASQIGPKVSFFGISLLPLQNIWPGDWNFLAVLAAANALWLAGSLLLAAPLLLLLTRPSIPEANAHGPQPEQRLITLRRVRRAMFSLW